MAAEERLEWEKLPTEELVAELEVTGLTLPPGLIEAIVRRGREAVPGLGHLITDADLWESDYEDAWAPLFALHLLGAIGDPAAAPFLVEMLRLNPEPDEVMDNTPTIIGHLGPTVIPEFARFILEEKADSLMRGVACDGLASIAVLAPISRSPIVGFLRQFVTDAGQHDPEAVTGAIMTLVELRDHESLPAIAQAFLLGQADETLFSLDDARAALARPETISTNWHYVGDPLDFFAAANLEKLRKRARHG